MLIQLQYHNVQIILRLRDDISEISQYVLSF